MRLTTILPLRMCVLAIHAVYEQFLRQKVAKIPGLDIDTSPAALNQVVRQIKNIPVRTSTLLVLIHCICAPLVSCC